jgi:hypothetical protein
LLTAVELKACTKCHLLHRVELIGFLQEIDILGTMFTRRSEPASEMQQGRWLDLMMVKEEEEWQRSKSWMLLVQVET